mgnify:FL=1
MRDFLERPIAHRGLHNENQIIENTLEAFENAIQNDYLIECDVVLSKDHEVLVFHDYDLKRLCNIEKNIADISSKELININLLNTKSKIPTLEEMFYLVNGRVPILIEIKKNFNPFIEERLLELTRTYQGEIAFQSFDIKACEWFRDNAPYYKTGLIVNDKVIDENEINKLNINFIAVDVEILMREDIQALRKNNFPTLTWTIDNERKYKLSKEFADNCIFENLLI